MVTKEDIESFLDRIDSGTANVGEVKPGTWVVKTVAGAEVVVHYAPPVVILRVTVMTLPAAEPRRSELLRELLELMDDIAPDRRAQPPVGPPVLPPFGL